MAVEISRLEAGLKALKADADSYREAFKALEKYPGILSHAVALYEELLEKYKTLSGAYKDLESKGARHESKTDCAIERPYILVLIDAHTHGFADKYFLEGEAGGAAAAQAILKCVRRYSNRRALVRVYADLRTLSVPSPPAGSSDGEARQLAAFAAGFSQFDNFDFTDAGSEAMVETNVIAAFEEAIKDTQCEKIFIGAWRKPEYVSILSPYGKGNHGKVTLFPGKYGATGIKHLRLRTRYAASVRGGSRDRLRDTLFWSVADAAPSGMCLEYLKGRCSQKDCELLHSIPKRPSKSTRQGDIPGHSAEAGDPSSAEETSSINEVPRVIDKEADLTDPVIRKSLLPGREHSLDIPVNSSDHRLDPYIEYPSKDDWASYNSKFGGKAPCNVFHLRQKCYRKNCAYSHEQHDIASRRVHVYRTRKFPCMKGSACRDDRCFSGHICQNLFCLEAGSKARQCKLPEEMHTRDFAIHAWKLNENERPGSRVMNSKAADDDAAIDTVPKNNSHLSASEDLATNPHVEQNVTSDQDPIQQDVTSGGSFIQQENSDIQEEDTINVQQEKSKIQQVQPPKTTNSESSSPAEDREFASLIDLSIAQWFSVK